MDNRIGGDPVCRRCVDGKSVVIDAIIATPVNDVTKHDKTTEEVYVSCMYRHGWNEREQETRLLTAITRYRKSTQFFFELFELSRISVSATTIVSNSRANRSHGELHRVT